MNIYCPTCGMVRTATGAAPLTSPEAVEERLPFCRHYAPELVAGRMVPLPRWHPLNWYPKREQESA